MLERPSMRTTTVRSALFGASAVLSLLHVLPSAVKAQTFPDDDAWRALACGRVPSFDPRRDEPGASLERDIVGDAERPAIYLSADATHVFFRMRVDGQPAVDGDFEPFGWGVAIDSNLDRRDYELLVMLDGRAMTDTVRLLRNSVPMGDGDPRDPAEQELATYPGAMNARAVLAEGPFASRFGGDADYFVDIAVERDDLAGVSPTTPLLLVFGTSTDGAVLDADLACHVAGEDPRTFAGAASDAVTISGEDVPDRDDDGVPDSEEEARGTDPDREDSDGDGYPDGVEIREGTDPNDPNSTPQNLKLRGGGGAAGGCSLRSGTGAPWGVLLALIALRRGRRRRVFLPG